MDQEANKQFDYGYLTLFDSNIIIEPTHTS